MINSFKILSNSLLINVGVHKMRCQVARALNFVQWHVMFVGPEHETACHPFEA